MLLMLRPLTIYAFRCIGHTSYHGHYGHYQRCSLDELGASPTKFELFSAEARFAGRADDFIVPARRKLFSRSHAAPRRMPLLLMLP